MRLLFCSEYGAIAGLIEADVKFDRDGRIKSGNITHHLSSWETVKTNFSSKREKVYVTSVTYIDAKNSSNSTVLYDQDTCPSVQSETTPNKQNQQESKETIDKLKTDCSTHLTSFVEEARQHCNNIPTVEELLSSQLWNEPLSIIVKDAEKTVSGRTRKHVKTARVELDNHSSGDESYIIEFSYLADGSVGKGRYIHWNHHIGTMVEFGDGVLKRVSVSDRSAGWKRLYDYKN